MTDDTRPNFTTEYQTALAQYLAEGQACTLEHARELGGLAKSLGVLSHEIVAAHAAALLACAPQGGVKEFAASCEFLTRSLQELEVESALQRAHSQKRAAHELRTPLTTLRLSLQVGVGRLEKGDTVDAQMLQKAIAQVDKLAAKISELLANSNDAFRNSPSVNP